LLIPSTRDVLPTGDARPQAGRSLLASLTRELVDFFKFIAQKQPDGPFWIEQAIVRQRPVDQASFQIEKEAAAMGF
jgi:hypothetical protein